MSGAIDTVTDWLMRHGRQAFRLNVTAIAVTCAALVLTDSVWLIAPFWAACLAFCVTIVFRNSPAGPRETVTLTEFNSILGPPPTGRPDSNRNLYEIMRRCLDNGTWSRDEALRRLHEVADSDRQFSGRL